MMRTQKKSERFDDSFYKLAAQVTRALERNKDGTLQKEQVEELLEAERRFKETVLRYRQSTEVYKRFLQKICVQNKNILTARPYFRETAKRFSKNVTPAIKAATRPTSDDLTQRQAIEKLKTFDINYQLISFIKKNWLGPFPERAKKLFERVHKARTRLIEDNMPLAINRAKLFYRKTPRSHLTLLDMISICGMGLAAGIDKYSAEEYSPVFRSVCIGRMVGNLIDDYSSTMLHFFPSDKRILYKANTLRARQGITDMVELAAAVNKSFAQDKAEGKSVPKNKVLPSQLADLMGAASTVSADETVNEEGFGVYDFTASAIPDPEKESVEREEFRKVRNAVKYLPLMHRKILQLKGVRFELATDETKRIIELRKLTENED